MRKYSLLLTLLASLSLSGCHKQSASYYLSDERDHAISVRAEQEYVWSKNITLSLVAANLPECQRAFPLEKVHEDEVAVELFTSADDIYTIRSGDQLVQLDMQTCNQLAQPAPTALGQAVGVFRLGEHDKMIFEPAENAATAVAGATPPSPPADATTTAAAAGAAPAAAAPATTTDAPSETAAEATPADAPPPVAK